MSSSIKIFLNKKHFGVNMLEQRLNIKNHRVYLTRRMGRGLTKFHEVFMIRKDERHRDAKTINQEVGFPKGIRAEYTFTKQIN